MVTVSFSAVGTTTAVANFAAGNGSPIELQLSASERFAFVPSPIYAVGANAAFNLTGLNQRASYYARARNVADGVPGEWSAVAGFRTGAGAAQVTQPAAVMIDRAMIVKPEPVLEITGTSPDAGFALENLLADAPVAFKRKGVNGAFLYMRTAGSPIDTIALLNTNVAESAIVEIYYGESLDGLANGSARTRVYQGPFRASPNLPGRRGYHGLWTFPAVQATWWLVVVVDNAITAQTFYAEHLVMGLNRVTKNHAVEKTETPMPKSTIERARSGVPDRLDGIAMRKVEFDIAMLTEQQYETVYGDLVYAENEPFLIVPNSKAGAFLHDRILFGDLKGSRIFNPNTPRFTRTFVIESLI